MKLNLFNDLIATELRYIQNIYKTWNLKTVIHAQNDIFPNTIHWQYGHVLTVFESSLCIVGKHTTDVGRYMRLFGYGTSPNNWKGQEVPDMEEILEHMGTLSERVNSLTEAELNQCLPHRVNGMVTVKDCIVMNAMHVALHAGKIEEMSRVFKQELDWE